MFRILLSCTLMLLMTCAVWAETPLGGLAVAVSPDGETVVAAGDSRTLYVLDAETLTVKERHWLGTTVTRMTFTGDGSALIVAGSDGALQWLQTSDWQPNGVTAKADQAIFAHGAQLIVGKSGSKKLIIYSMTDGKKQQEIETGELRISHYGLSPDGKRLMVWDSGATDENEPKVSYGDIPKDLKGVARDEFRQRNDGRTSTYRFYDLASGEVTQEAKSWYQSNSSSIIGFVGDDVVVVPYNGLSLRLAKDGSASAFELSHGLNYGSALNADHSKIAGGSLRDYSISATTDMAGAKTQIDKIKGWPEYFESFTFAADGTAYAGTSAYRVVKIHADGSTALVKPVF